MQPSHLIVALLFYWFGVGVASKMWSRGWLATLAILLLLILAYAMGVAVGWVVWGKS